jgi:hypothetical protein
MKTNKTITLLGKELTISQIYKTRAHVNEEYTGKAEAIEIDIRELTDFVTSEEDAKQLAQEMSEYIYNEVYNDCKAKAAEGEALYAYQTLSIFFKRSEIRSDGYISSSAMYVECNGGSERSFTFANLDIDRKDEEDEEGEEIADNIRYNEILDALSREEFNRRMSEDERGDFECLEDEARENYRRLHPEEFDEEEDN